eukprot:Phypoly_transcript_00255.p1 GENE.Phypoly_transcript_00255~~Phypoly_transcript_00255.p1  ORF type:complete len:939 (+),score=189.28 Phypoly_transcript_00255:2752-5568(+)
MSFLIKPLQRITRYPLLLKEILRHTSSTHPDFTGLTEVLGRFMNLVDHVNETTRRAEQELKGQEIQPLLDKGEELKLIADKRGLLREGNIKFLKMGGSGSLKKVEAHALLFDHMLVFAKTREASKKKPQQEGDPNTVTNSTYKYHTVAAIPLSDLMLSDSLSEKGLVALEIICVGEAIYTVSFETHEERFSWVHDIEQAILQHLKQLGKKDIAGLNHIDLLSTNEVDSLMFKRPLFDKDLTLAVMVPQILSALPVTRTSSIQTRDDNKISSGGGLKYFGKSHKHKYENMQHMKLFALEKALRRDLDAFTKALRKQVVELLASKRYYEHELQTARETNENAKQEQERLEHKIQAFDAERSAIITRIDQERLKRVTAETRLKETELQLQMEKAKVSVLENKLATAHAQTKVQYKDCATSPPTLVTVPSHEETQSIPISNSSIFSNSSPSSPSSPSAPTQVPTQTDAMTLTDETSLKSLELSFNTIPTEIPRRPSTELLNEIDKANITKTDKRGSSKNLAKPPHEKGRQTPSPRNFFNKQSSRASLRLTGSQANNPNKATPENNSSRSFRKSKSFSPATMSPDFAKSSVPPNQGPNKNATKPAVPPRQIQLSTTQKVTSPPPRPPRLKPPIPQRPTPPVPQRQPSKSTLKPLPAKHPVPQKPPPPAPQKPTNAPKTADDNTNRPTHHTTNHPAHHAANHNSHQTTNQNSVNTTHQNPPNTTQNTNVHQTTNLNASQNTKSHQATSQNPPHSTQNATTRQTATNSHSSSSSQNPLRGGGSRNTTINVNHSTVTNKHRSISANTLPIFSSNASSSSSSSGVTASTTVTNKHRSISTNTLIRPLPPKPPQFSKSTSIPPTVSSSSLSTTATQSTTTTATTSRAVRAQGHNQHTAKPPVPARLSRSITADILAQSKAKQPAPKKAGPPLSNLFAPLVTNPLKKKK